MAKIVTYTAVKYKVVGLRCAKKSLPQVREFSFYAYRNSPFSNIIPAWITPQL
jgi:hypothetical protein